MIEIHLTGENAAKLWNEGVESGCARWRYETLTFGRERVTMAVREEFSAADETTEEFFMAYLEDQWKQKAAAVWKDEKGTMRWYSKALERLYRAENG